MTVERCRFVVTHPSPFPIKIKTKIKSKLSLNKVVYLDGKVHANTCIYARIFIEHLKARALEMRSINSGTI